MSVFTFHTRKLLLLDEPEYTASKAPSREGGRAGRRRQRPDGVSLVCMAHLAKAGYV